MLYEKFYSFFKFLEIIFKVHIYAFDRNATWKKCDNLMHPNVFNTTSLQNAELMLLYFNNGSVLRVCYCLYIDNVLRHLLKKTTYFKILLYKDLNTWNYMNALNNLCIIDNISI